MNQFEFTNPEVKEKYESTFGIDKKITIQGTYRGMLSKITPEAAAKLIALKDNQIKLKAVKALTGKEPSKA